MNRRRRLVLLAFLSAAWLAAGARSALAIPHLTAPVAGVELTAGSQAAVEWEGTPPPGAEEWEAFLSLDGGRTYPLRITPHLDLSIRRFAFRVPQLPTRDARLLLRFGDERREMEIETPERFAIGAHARFWAPPMPALVPGERPRPRDPGVVLWVEGSRDGTGLHEVAVDSSLLALRSIQRPASRRTMPWISPTRPTRTRTDEIAAPLAGDEESSAPVPLRLGIARPSATAPAPLAVRLLTHRFNE